MSPLSMNNRRALALLPVMCGMLLLTVASKPVAAQTVVPASANAAIGAPVNLLLHLKKPVAAHAPSAEPARGFAEPERQAIITYFSNLPPVPEELRPPANREKLQAGQSLPKGVAGRILPRDLDRSLPPPPAGHERVIVDSDVLMVELGSRRVIDVIPEATTRRQKG
jgi:hypothetical protein